LDKAARQPGGDQVHGQDLNSVSVRASGLNARTMGGKPCVDDNGPTQCGHCFCHCALTFFERSVIWLMRERDRARAFVVSS